MGVEQRFALDSNGDVVCVEDSETIIAQLIRIRFGGDVSSVFRSAYTWYKGSDAANLPSANMRIEDDLRAFAMIGELPDYVVRAFARLVRKAA